MVILGALGDQGREAGQTKQPKQKLTQTLKQGN